MSPRPDHIPLNRPKSSDVSLQGSSESGRPQQRTLQDESDRLRRFKIAALLTALLAVLILIALLSYTDRDEANAQLTMRDAIGVIRGDDALRLRFETTYNWLGLLGAVIAHWMYTATLGIWSLVVPVLMLFWSRDVFRFQRITPLVARRSVIVLAAAISLSAICGTLQLIEFTSWLPRESCGAIGQFIAGVATQFIGRAGSLIISLSAFIAIIVLGFEINVRGLAQWRIWSGLGGQMSDYFRSLKKPSEIRRQGANDDDLYDEEPEQEDLFEDEELNVIIRPAPNSTAPRKSGRAVISPADLDDEPAAMLPRPSQPASSSNIPPEGVQLSGSVRILRPSRPEPPTVEETEDDEIEDEDASTLDSTEVQKRLQQLHPNKDVLGDTPVVVPAPLKEKPLVVTVQDTLFPIEPEMALSNTTLYDEEIAYKPPTASLLIDVKDEAAVDDKELEANARTLQEKLETFRVRIENLTVTPGPVVTQYEFVPASGIKVSQIESLADDIALALKAQGVRIIAPIPGKGTVGIEIPNQHPSIVRFSSIIKSPKYHNPDIKLPLAMGKTVIGEVFCADLTKMPHLLIAGATGKGKSVGINTIIASLLYRMHPRDLKFVIVDPKRVEMNLYASLRDHFLAISPDIEESIITSPTNAVIVLKALVEEMQQRFSILAAAGQRNIADYNQKVRDGKIKDKGGIIHRPMPFIVVIIDELADLMMTASKEVEEPICRLAQLARAVGIHCIVATQRPSVDVVTGLIKANFPARIAYQVSSRIDSRTILDGTGAEHLIGNGDMLFAPGNTPMPIRMQNAFISTEEVEALCDWIGSQKGYSTPYMLPSISKRVGPGGGSGDDRDALFEDAARIFIQLQQASTSTLQRRLKIGYARAARIVDDLEMAGIVGPPDGSRGRPVLLQSESELEAYL